MDINQYTYVVMRTTHKNLTILFEPTYVQCQKKLQNQPLSKKERLKYIKKNSHWWLAKSDNTWIECRSGFFLVNYYIFFGYCCPRLIHSSRAEKCGKFSSSHNNNIIVQCDFFLAGMKCHAARGPKLISWLKNYCACRPQVDFTWTQMISLVMYLITITFIWCVSQKKFCGE